jgi:hypothetical protein
MDLRGAKSNVMSLIGTYRNRKLPSCCPFWTRGHLRRLEFTKIIGELKRSAISLTSSHVLRTGFPTGGMPCTRGLCPRLLICEIEPNFRFDLNPRRRRERALTGWITL